MIFKKDDLFTTKLAITDELVKEFEKISGDSSPLHTDSDYAKEKGFQGIVAHGNILNLMVSTLVGMRLGTPDVMLLTQQIRYRLPVYAGSEISLSGTVKLTSESTGIVELSLKFRDQEDRLIADGKCQFKTL